MGKIVSAPDDVFLRNTQQLVKNSRNGSFAVPRLWDKIAIDRARTSAGSVADPIRRIGEKQIDASCFHFSQFRKAITKDERHGSLHFGDIQLVYTRQAVTGRDNCT